LQNESLDPGSLPPVETGLHRLSEQVVLILVDSLPERVGNNPDIMPNLVELGKRGAHGVMIAPPDTVTTAGVRAMTVGTKPGFSDALALFSHRHYPYWTVFDGMVGNGEEVAFFGDHSWTDLLGDRAKDQPSGTKLTDLYGDYSVAFADARSHLKQHPHIDFTALHIARTDFYAHQYGTERPEYKQFLRGTDEDIAKFVSEALADGETTVIVTSDHGNDYFGNHGGSGDIYRRVPLVLAGAGIRKMSGFEMEGRQLPLALAVLLGTKLPGGIAMPLPPGFLNLTVAETAKLEWANLERLRRIGSFFGVASPETKTADELVSLIEQSSRPDAGLVLWVPLLFLTLILVYLAVTTGALPVPGLVACSVFMLLLCFSSQGRAPLLGIVSALLLALVTTELRALRQPKQALLVAGGTLAILGVSIARFVLGGKFLFAAAKLLGPLAVIAVAVAAWRSGLGRKRIQPALAGAMTWLVPLALVALGILQPLEIVPVLFCSLTFIGFLAAGSGELEAAGVSILVFLFFVFSQRLGFGWTGERMSARYVYAAVAGGLVTGLVLLRGGPRGRAWIALLCLVPPWAFGFLHISRAFDSVAVQSTVLLLGGLAAVAFNWLSGASRLCLVPLAVGAFYHFFPEVPLFWAALAVHAAVGAAVISRERTVRARQLSLAAVFLSFLFLTSPGADFISIMLFCLVPFLVLDEKAGRLGDGALIAVAAVLVAYARYGIFDSSGHAPGAPYSLGNIDTHSGFAAITGNVNVWVPTAIVVGKMIVASALVYMLALVDPKRRDGEGKVLLASLALVLLFLLEAAVELALSYGKNDARLSLSMVQMIIHGGILVIVAAGYGLYRLLMIEGAKRARG
jgi:hypothetical protein